MPRTFHLGGLCEVGAHKADIVLVRHFERRFEKAPCIVTDEVAQSVGAVCDGFVDGARNVVPS
jgi:hypothetical protein